MLVPTRSISSGVRTLPSLRDVGSASKYALNSGTCTMSVNNNHSSHFFLVYEGTLGAVVGSRIQASINLSTAWSAA